MEKKQYKVPDSVWQWIKPYMIKEIKINRSGFRCKECEEAKDLFWKNLSLALGFRLGTEEFLEEKWEEHIFLAEPTGLMQFKSEAFNEGAKMPLEGKIFDDETGNSDLA